MKYSIRSWNGLWIKKNLIIINTTVSSILSSTLINHQQKQQQKSIIDHYTNAMIMATTRNEYPLHVNNLQNMIWIWMS
ncbi:hypothetical protein DERP_004172 [Dermatophagoides pteronyssinus]|uniref:Uncharacterized protein n=1 Tax=Dermatophagoides pteronyssinus TaxID=6956 RepID=A0ABQ8J8D7_DERPT|nr:hypothetical protein DERP_004172 [Dermatophagoides pteronyssinus]